MIGALLGLPGKMATLLARLSSGRATALDHLDADITSCAAAATALSTAQWTNALATNLGALASGGSGVIQSIQTAYVDSAFATSGPGEEHCYLDVTISAVVVAKSIILHGYFMDAADSVVWGMTSRLTSTTNLRFGSSITMTTSFRGRYYVVEFK